MLCVLVDTSIALGRTLRITSPVRELLAGQKLTNADNETPDFRFSSTSRIMMFSKTSYQSRCGGSRTYQMWRRLRVVDVLPHAAIQLYVPTALASIITDKPTHTFVERFLASPLYEQAGRAGK